MRGDVYHVNVGPGAKRKGGCLKILFWIILIIIVLAVIGAA